MLVLDLVIVVNSKLIGCEFVILSSICIFGSMKRIGIRYMMFVILVVVIDRIIV